eukprot:6431799-Amphidinium_carterae.1
MASKVISLPILPVRSYVLGVTKANGEERLWSRLGRKSPPDLSPCKTNMHLSTSDGTRHLGGSQILGRRSAPH